MTVPHTSYSRRVGIRSCDLCYLKTLVPDMFFCPSKMLLKPNHWDIKSTRMDGYQENRL